MRLTLPEATPVWTSSLSSFCTNHTGVATPVPSRLYVVMLRYLPRNVHVTGAPSVRVSSVVISSPYGSLAHGHSLMIMVTWCRRFDQRPADGHRRLRLAVLGGTVPAACAARVSGVCWAYQRVRAC